MKFWQKWSCQKCSNGLSTWWSRPQIHKSKTAWGIFQASCEICIEITGKLFQMAPVTLLNLCPILLTCVNVLLASLNIIDKISRSIFSLIRWTNVCKLIIVLTLEIWQKSFFILLFFSSKYSVLMCLYKLLLMSCFLSFLCIFSPHRCFQNVADFRDAFF